MSTENPPFRLDAKYYTTAAQLAFAVTDLSIREYGTHPHRLSVEDIWAITDTLDIARGPVSDHDFSQLFAAALKVRCLENMAGIMQTADLGCDIMAPIVDAPTPLGLGAASFTRRVDELSAAGYTAVHDDLIHWQKGDCRAEIAYNDDNCGFDILYHPAEADTHTNGVIIRVMNLEFVVKNHAEILRSHDKAHTLTLAAFTKQRDWLERSMRATDRINARAIREYGKASLTAVIISFIAIGCEAVRLLTWVMN